MKAQIYTHNTWINETDQDKLKLTLERMLIDSGFGVEGRLEKHFTPQGYSCVWLLSESHLAVHTFPEHGCSSIELSSCIKAPFDRCVTLIVKRWEDYTGNKAVKL